MCEVREGGHAEVDEREVEDRDGERKTQQNRMRAGKNEKKKKGESGMRRRWRSMAGNDRMN